MLDMYQNHKFLGSKIRHTTDDNAKLPWKAALKVSHSSESCSLLLRMQWKDNITVDISKVHYENGTWRELVQDHV
jgi:hypothetical protein